MADATSSIANQVEVSINPAPAKLSHRQKRNLPLAYDDPTNFCKHCGKRGFKSLNCKSSHECVCRKRLGLPARQKKAPSKRPCEQKVAQAVAHCEDVPPVEIGQAPTTAKRRASLAHTHGSFGVSKALNAGLILDDAQFDPAKHCTACLSSGTPLLLRDYEVTPPHPHDLGYETWALALASSD